MMQPPENEPTQEEIDALVTGENRQVLEIPSVPDDVKAEIQEQLERREEDDLDQEQAEDARNLP